MGSIEEVNTKPKQSIDISSDVSSQIANCHIILTLIRPHYVDVDALNHQILRCRTREAPSGPGTTKPI